MKTQPTWKTRLIVGGLLLLAATSCFPPQEYIRTDSDSGRLIFKVEPEVATVLIDGEPIGLVRDFNGKPVILELPAGVHEIELRHDDYESFRTKVYLSDTLETVSVAMRKK